MQSPLWLFCSLSLLLSLSMGRAQKLCDVKLPLLNTSVRIIGGRPAQAVALDNVVTLAYEDAEGLNYVCVGSLIHPLWVLTAAQCPIAPDSNFALHGGSSLTGARYEIETVVPHPMYELPTRAPWRYDLQLVRLRRPILLTSDTVPTESPAPSPEQIDLSRQNVMRVNNNTAFARSPRRTYLRLKGYGMNEPPYNNQQPLTHKERPLLFADMPISPCPEPERNDRARRICTASSATCGPCFGDTGSPLYDVDKSGTVAVLVAIATLGRHDSYEVQKPFCTNGRIPIIYTTVAPYVSWIRRTIGNATLSEFFIPLTGINNVVLATPKSSFPVAARTSIIVVCTLVLAGLLGTLIFLSILRRMRARRRRWRTGLEAEDSFINSRSPDVFTPDPFEGIQRERRSTLSVSQLSSNAIERLKRAKEYSTRSLSAIRAKIIKQEESIEIHREEIPDAPEWVSSAWDKLFRAPSKSDLSSIHKIPTQRVVDDVLTGTDKSVEPSLQEVAFQAAREEANLEAAWHRLEVQTSLRSMSEGASANLTPPLSPLPRSPQSGSRGMFSGLSRSGSKRGSAPSSPLRRALSPSRPPPGELAKADTLLAAFAPIDNESERVEETIIDSAALRALATAKRPNIVNALRRMLSGSGEKEGNPSSDESSNGPPNSSRRGISSRQAGSSSGVHENLFSLSSKHSSAHMDYLSENYSVSDSGSEGDAKELFEQAFMAGTRRYTDDRRPDFEETRSIPTLRGYRKGPSLSLEELERRRSNHVNEENVAEVQQTNEVFAIEREQNLDTVSPALPLPSHPMDVAREDIENESSSQAREHWSKNQEHLSRMSRFSVPDASSSLEVGGKQLSLLTVPPKSNDPQTDWRTESIRNISDLESVRFEGHEKTERSRSPVPPTILLEAIEPNASQERSITVHSCAAEKTKCSLTSPTSGGVEAIPVIVNDNEGVERNMPHERNILCDEPPKVRYETIDRDGEAICTKRRSSDISRMNCTSKNSNPDCGVLAKSGNTIEIHAHHTQEGKWNHISMQKLEQRDEEDSIHHDDPSSENMRSSLPQTRVVSTGESDGSQMKISQTALTGELPEVRPETPEPLGRVNEQIRGIRYTRKGGSNRADRGEDPEHLSVPRLKEIWNDRVRRDSENGAE